MSTPDDKKKIPEWSIFDRLDEVEKITLELMEKTDTVEPTLKDTAILAVAGFLLSVGFHIVEAPNSIEAKDATMTFLKGIGLSKETLDMLDKSLTTICQAAKKLE